jgi:hypothetical protein
MWIARTAQRRERSRRRSGLLRGKHRCRKFQDGCRCRLRPRFGVLLRDLYRSPLQSNILQTEIQTAARVAKLIFDSGLARVPRPTDMVGFIRGHVYKPEYASLAATKTAHAAGWLSAARQTARDKGNKVQLSRSMIPNARDVIPQKRHLVFRSLQKNEESISRIDHPQRPEILVHDRDVQKLPLFHDRPDVFQQVTRPAEDNILGHHRSNGDGAIQSPGKCSSGEQHPFW